MDARLREKGGGSLEGKKLGTMERMAKEAKVSIRKFRAPGGGESWEDVATRSRSFMRDLPPLLRSDHAASSLTPVQHKPSEIPERTAAAAAESRSAASVRKLLVVTHGGFIRELLNSHIAGAKATNSARNCGLFVLDLLVGRGMQTRWRLVLDNDASHLSASQLEAQ